MNITAFQILASSNLRQISKFVAIQAFWKPLHESRRSIISRGVAGVERANNSMSGNCKRLAALVNSSPVKLFTSLYVRLTNPRTASNHVLQMLTDGGNSCPGTLSNRLKWSCFFFFTFASKTMGNCVAMHGFREKSGLQRPSCWNGPKQGSTLYLMYL